MNNVVTIIGGGLAGCEAAWQARKLGMDVNLYEMKPKRFTPAHSLNGLCELVCSNSLKSMRMDTASGLLKEELKLFDSLIISAAYRASVAAGSALAVNREDFSTFVTESLVEAGVNIINEEVFEVPNVEGPLIIATGPLTDGAFAKSLKEVLGGADSLSFYDAIAPIIYTDSIDFDHAFKGSRYGKGGDDYINCPMTKDEYEVFFEALINAEKVKLKDFEQKIPFFESCMPVEALASRGFKTLLFGPLKPVGFTDPDTGRRPYAIIQLRAENREGTTYNMVGFQTNLTYGEQKRVFRLIPALKDAKFAKLGSMHRNSFIDAPKFLNDFLELKEIPGIYVAGTLSGVEGYIESAATGLITGINSVLGLLGSDKIVFPETSVLGALTKYICHFEGKKFQPMNANFGILPLKGKKDAREAFCLDSLEKLKAYKNKNLASFTRI